MKSSARGFCFGAILITLVLAGLGASGLKTNAVAPAPRPQETLRGGPPAVLRKDPTISNLRIPPPNLRSPLHVQSATVTVKYLPGGTKNIYGSECYDWPNDAKIAFDYAASIWASLINSTVPIEVNACWTDLAESILGYGATASYHLNSANSSYYPAALANALDKSDLNDSDGYDDDGDGLDKDDDIIVAYNRNFDWYFGTDGRTPTNKIDLSSVVLHEICHGLGFAGAMRVDDGNPANGVECNGSAGVGCWRVYTTDPANYDRFTENGSGQATIGFSNYSLALGAHLTSENVYFDGANATAANGGTPPALFAPSTWMQGSSYSHLGEGFNGSPNALMTYSLSNGESSHSPGPVAMGLLQDLGWGATQAAPDLSLSMYPVGNVDPAPGDPIKFALSVSNVGQGVATGVVVTNLLSSDILTPSWSVSLALNGTTLRGGTRYVWDLPDLAANASGVITVSGTLNPALSADQAILGRASISANETEEDTDNNSGFVVIGGTVRFLPMILRGNE